MEETSRVQALYTLHCRVQALHTTGWGARRREKGAGNREKAVVCMEEGVGSRE